MLESPNTLRPASALLLTLYILLFSTFTLLTVLDPQALAQNAIPLGKYEIGLHGTNLGTFFAFFLILGPIPLTWLAKPR